MSFCNIQCLFSVNVVHSAHVHYKHCYGCSVDSDYMNHVAEEINDKLQEQGQVTLAEVTTSYGLPAEFLANVRP